ncbi:MAG: metallophosphoesterase [Acidobacteria bacterium]|nr:metallophosphoesterase [Acidobacteriota bacterium]
MKRRDFLAQAAIAGASLISPRSGYSLEPHRKSSAGQKNKAAIRFGICADLHQDLISDGPSRLKAFIDEMNQMKPDFIIQMGDFCTPKEQNREIVDIWNTFPGPKYHVIGNHDRDGGFTFEQVLSFWGATAEHYSFDRNGYHFIVLNGNERAPKEDYKGYAKSIGPEQRRWLKEDLAATKLPVIVFCHQGIDNDMDGIHEGNHLRIIFEDANRKAGFTKVRVVFSGHHHRDYLNVYNAIHYVQINSISYQFKHNNGGFDFAHCKDPLWAFVSIDEAGDVKLKGRRSVYENGSEEWDNGPEFDEYPTVAHISDRSFRV